MQQQLIALGMGSGGASRKALLQQGQAPLAVALAHVEAAELGAGVGIAGAGLQFVFHGLPQPLGLVAAQ